MDCPECGSATVTIDLDSDPGSDIPPTLSITEAILELAESETIGVTRLCWECGWRETRAVTLDTIDVESGDESVAERRRIIKKIKTELDQIDESASLREVLAETERVRQK
jgi:hypothetical protein